MTLKTVQAGDALPSFTTPPISSLTLALFAGGSGDHNPIHVDPEFARANGFPGVFAHGMLSMAYLGRLLTAWAPTDRIVSYGVRFAAITPLKAAVTCSGRVTEVVEEAGRRIAGLELTAALEDGTVTLVGDAAVTLD
jgi:acyl dehydratase